MSVKQHEIIYDWNELAGGKPAAASRIELVDETLRDGIQSPSVTDPAIEEKVALVRLMATLGIGSVTLGLPGAGARAYSDVLELATQIRDGKIGIAAACAARTTVKDIEPIADIVQKVGVPIEVNAFIASSPIRLYAEGWSVDTLLEHIDESLRFSRENGLDYCLVTEDTTRSRPQVLEPMIRRAADGGAKRWCLCDTVGHATPHGIRNLFAWVKETLPKIGASHIKLDWHGHNDRGLGVSNALCAIECGADRVHGTGLGIGERVGNASLDQILINLKLQGLWDHDVSSLLRYVQEVARFCRVPIPCNYPIAGVDAFRTGTGVHAAAIVKAHKKGDQFLADRVYSGVPAGMFGRHQEIEVGHMSGHSNVLSWLQSRRIAYDDVLVQAIFVKAKAANRLLSTEEIMAIVEHHQGR